MLLFDGDLNSNLQSKQQDIHIRFWKGSQISSHFYTSEYLGRADAGSLHEKLIDCCATIGKQGLLQISLDGPSVNWKTHDLLFTSIEEKIHKTMLNIGSCGLHIVHNAFRSGSMETSWEVGQTLSHLTGYLRTHQLGVTTLWQSLDHLCPKQFSSHRWVENVTVVERALEMWPHVK